MHTLDTLETLDIEAEVEHLDLLKPLLRARSSAKLREPASAEIGELMALDAVSGTAWVRLAATPNSNAVAARSTVDLHGAHIGRSVVLVYEGGDRRLPIVVGVLRGERRADDAPIRPVTIDVDGDRLVVDAKQQLVLQCGKARITLTSAGKVLIEGSYISSRSTGVNRVKGGSVQLN